MALSWAEQTRLWDQVNTEMGSRRNPNGTGWSNPNGRALRNEYNNRLNAANAQRAAQEAAASQRQAEIARQEQLQRQLQARQEQLQREAAARQEQLQREAEAREAERLRQMEIGQRTQEANTARAGLESKFQISSSSKSPRTAGTQAFKRKKLQINPVTANALSGILGGTAATTTTNTLNI